MISENLVGKQGAKERNFTGMKPAVHVNEGMQHIRE